MRIRVPSQHCKRCEWLDNQKFCMFSRCVKRKGWALEAKK